MGTSAISAPPDNLYALAVAVVIRERCTSTARLMCYLGDEAGEPVGYNRCAYFMARMEIEGIVGRIDSENRREVLAWPN